MTVTYSNPPGSMPAQGLYTNVGSVTGGSLHFIAGQLSVAQDGSVHGVADFEKQFEHVFATLGDVLRGLNGDFRSVVKFTTYLVHSQDISKFMACRARLFPGYFSSDVFPPNTLLIVDRLVKEEFLIEVEAVAAI